MPKPKTPKVRTLRNTSYIFKELTERISYEEHKYHPQGEPDNFYTYDVRCLDITLKKTLSSNTVLNEGKTRIFIRLQYREFDSTIYDYFPSLDYIRYFDADDETAEVVYSQIIYDMPDWDTKFVEFLGFEREGYDE